MPHPTWHDLRTLAEHEQSGSISLYLSPAQPAQPLRARMTEHRNAIASLRSQLEHHGHDRAATGELLETIDRRVQPEIDRAGTAMFMSTRPSTNVDETFAGLSSVESLAVVGSRFHLLPLLNGADTPEFFVLSLSLGDVRLYRCCEDGNLAPAGNGDVPSSIDEALAFDDRESALTTHSGGRAGPNVTAMFHGHGGTADARMRDTQRFLRVVSRAVMSIVGHTPVVLAGTDTIVAAYRATAEHRMAAEHLQPNPRREHLRDLELRSHALYEREQLTNRRTIAARAVEAAAAGSGSLDNVEIADALASGRAGQLILAADHHRWGHNGGITFDTASAPRRPADHDLLNDFAIEALRTGVEITVVDTDALDSADAGVIYRY